VKENSEPEVEMKQEIKKIQEFKGFLSGFRVDEEVIVDAIEGLETVAIFTKEKYISILPTIDNTIIFEIPHPKITIEFFGEGLIEVYFEEDEKTENFDVNLDQLHETLDFIF
jgi:hypothetical protein